MDCLINGKAVRLLPRHAIGKGGEADIFQLGNQAVKIFKPPSHPDFTGQPEEKKAAILRIKEHQTKLKDFPKGMPPHVVSPSSIVYDKKGGVAGYTMPLLDNAEVLLRFADRKFRESGIDPNVIPKILLDLHTSVYGLHEHNVVIGDFNDLNVMVKADEAYIIDADSFQYGRYFCKLFTARFVDPLLCDKRFKRLMLTKPHNPMSDWYAFAVMLFETLLYVDPYGGVYRPKDKARAIHHDARPLQRITVFHPEVRYPKPALPIETLPDDLLHEFHRIFEKDVREMFPTKLLKELRFTTCTACGKAHARSVCPFCQQVAERIKKEVVRMMGKVTARRLFHTKGKIVYATLQGGTLKYVFHQDGFFRREGDFPIIKGDPDPQLRFRIKGSETLIGKGRKVYRSTSGKFKELFVDTVGNMSIIDANSDTAFWLASGKLMKDGALGEEFPEVVGEALANQTLIWVSDIRGFGWYRAGNINIAFVFDPRRKGINDSVSLPNISGQLVDVQCYFSSHYCFLATTSREQGTQIHRVIVIDGAGKVVASTTSADPGSEWLTSIRGFAASAKMLFVPSDEGIKRIDVSQGTLEHKTTFVDTEQFVSSADKLFVSRDGIYVVNTQDITLLTVKE